MILIRDIAVSLTCTQTITFHYIEHISTLKSLIARYTQRPFYGSLDFVWDKPGEPAPEETFTNSHLSWSSIIPYLLQGSSWN